MNLPEDFIKMLKNDLGETKASEVISDMAKEPSVAIRINPSKIDSPMIGQTLAHLPIAGNVPHCKTGFFLSQRPSFTHDPLFHAGAYYVQDASSMIVEKILEYIDNKEFRALDLCAAPGGKSTHLISLLDRYENSLVVCNEVIRTRATILAENIAKWGYPNVCVTNNDPADFSSLENYFDIILVDAPCSGEGMFRKDEGAIAEWSLENVHLCAQRQRRIVADIWPALANGGIMAYSTCTINREEDEENVEWICKELKGEQLYSRRFYPGGEDAGEGIFFAIIRKEGEEIQRDNRKNFSTPKTLTKYPAKVDLVKDGYTLFKKKEILKCYPKEIANEMIALEGKLKVIHSGVAVAEVLESKKGAPVIIPHTDLVQSKAYNRGAIPELEISLEQALAFLKREPLTLPQGAAKGYILLTFNTLPLGLVKNLGNRTNNLWPNSRRILK